MFEETTLEGKLTLRNRIVFSPYIEYQANKNGTISTHMADFYLQMAREGVGLMIMESAYVTQQGRAHTNQLGISTENHVEGLSRLIKNMHEEGAKVALRLAHAGARTSEMVAGEQPVAPSSINFGKDYDPSREFDDGDIEEIILFFVHAAERAEECGADLIEINGGQMYLLDQCTSGRINNRADNYGGNIEQRMNLAVEIIKAIKSRVSPQMPISYMFSIHDKLEDGFDSNELKGMIKALNSAKVDFYHPVSIHVLNKFFDTEETLVEWVGKLGKKSIIADGNIKSPQILKEAMSLYKSQLFALDKVIFTRPNWYSFLKKKIPPPQ
ncbi:MAG: NADH:flavin oxidoreductase [Deltaproteobacteria bacterium]|nr:NADH:flavin oxidoreductase [Deltaproteobacteria bacterium]